MIIADGKLTIVGANSGDTPYTITVDSSGVATLGPTYFTDLNVTGTLTTTAATISSLSASGAIIDSILADRITVDELDVSTLFTAEKASIDIASINILNAPDNSTTPQFNNLNVNTLNVVDVATIPNATIGNASLTNLAVSSISGAPLPFEGSGDIVCEIDAYDPYLLILINKSKYGYLEVLATATEYPEQTTWSTLLSHANPLPDPREAQRMTAIADGYQYPSVSSWTVGPNVSYQIYKWLMAYITSSTPLLPAYVWIGFKTSIDGPIISQKRFAWDDQLRERGSITFTLPGGANVTDNNAISINADIFSEGLAVITNESANSTAALRTWVGGNSIQMQTLTSRGISAAHFSESNGIWYDEPGAYRETALPGMYFKNETAE